MKPRSSFLRMSMVLGLAVLAVAMLSLAPPTLVSAQGGDTAELVDVDPRPGDYVIAAGRPVRFSVKLNYTMDSADRANLTVYAEEYPDRAGGCTGDTHVTNGAGSTPVHRGVGNVVVSFNWGGNSPAYARGYISLGANLVAPDQRQVIKKLGQFRVCYRFAPGQRID